jgi:signal transduction histidine kinase
LAPRAREKGLEIAWAAPASAGRIHADESRLRQILLNFAANAVKFTNEGGVILRVAPRAGRLRFTVEDTGPASPCRPRAHLRGLRPGRRAADRGRRLGLGLAIARRLALAMDGEVGVEPGRNGGACFWFEAAFRLIASDQPAPLLAGRTVGVASPSRSSARPRAARSRPAAVVRSARPTWKAC